MKAFDVRLSKLEMQSPCLSPHLRRWLGQAVTDQEIADFDEGRLLVPDFDDGPVYSRLSPEARKWLGL